MHHESEIDVYLGLDVGKGEHHGTALTPAGKRVFDKPLPNSEPRLRELFTKLRTRHGTVLVVVDQPASIGALPLAVARDAGCCVAYLPGLTMRRIADLYPGESKTDARDAAIIADAARTMPHTLRELAPDDETVAELNMIVGFDDDLAGEVTRLKNRMRGLLTQIHPSLERVLGPRLDLLEAHPLSQVLISMPGIGIRTAARILVDVGDGSSFASAGHLAAYAGLAPATRRSGSSIRGEHPSRRGNRQLKRAFYLAAFASLSQPDSRAYYDRKRREGKHHVAALICLARRRIDVLFAMLRDGTFYQPPTAATA
ncbi:transposase [Streptomyces niveus]|uniref:IS110 family transposase n=1 Tax=Streptomyces niveus TaxID=193462 RepID=UPI0036D26730